ncbi:MULTISPECIES: hypothetical protein [Brucella]|uniref:Uncharacterized membrane protein HdeD (DUF308 family) n=2 Tax=Brucella TaxID=234 RepID=A0ABR6APF2_9HYPH|nr:MULTISPECIES: hypothetical protein [Brucella]KAB2684745.1 hypothetical protein F9K78_04005 [Brucella pseudintermedia]MBA8851339.1 uncharacterized membrane protein HdeD (DUF308 family) [Brucella intermedia]MBB5701492.1 uncharacterized membrane protein HdeD (DUF308 family) [Brucella daejeonensis]NKB78871.1 hypothetical protein [Brucella daejeonensis]
MSVAALIFGLISIVAGVIVIINGLADRSGLFTITFLSYGFSAIAFGIFMMCMGRVIEHLGAIRAAQERIAEKLGNTN